MNRSRFLLLVIVLLAAFLRLWQLDGFPPGLYHDEAYYGMDGLSLVQGKTFPQFYEGWELYAQEAHGENPPEPTHWPLFFEGNYGREPLHVYLVALSIMLFGPTPFAIRLVPALSGVLAVLLTYFAAKELLNQPGGTVRKPATAKANQSPISNLHSYAPLLAAFFLVLSFFVARNLVEVGRERQEAVRAQQWAQASATVGVAAHELQKHVETAADFRQAIDAGVD